MRVPAVFLSALLVSSVAAAQAPDPAQQIFVSNCAGCHGSNGNGGELGPDISMRVPARTDEELIVKFDKAGLKVLSGMLAKLEKL